MPSDRKWEKVAAHISSTAYTLPCLSASHLTLDCRLSGVFGLVRVWDHGVRVVRTFILLSCVSVFEE